MADYKTLKGFKIKSLASDPTVDLGQLWYNTASNTLKFDAIGAGAWASSNSMGTARRYLALMGTQTAAVTGGAGYPPMTATELYDGTTWVTNAATMHFGDHTSGGLGVQTAAMAVGGGGTSTLSETWNGTSWSEGNDLLTGGNFGMASGTTTAGLAAFAENTTPTGYNNNIYDGTCWTEGNNILTRRYGVGHSTSVSTAVIVATGLNAPGSITLDTMSWDGTSWTEVNDVNTARMFTTGAGTQTSTVIFGGNPGPGPPPVTTTNVVEQWDGTSWTEVADLATARFGLGGCGTVASAIAAAGATPVSIATCEEWSGAPVAVHTVTTS